MLIWTGIDVLTREPVNIHDTPLRVVVGNAFSEWTVEGEKVAFMAIAVSANLGTAAMVLIRDETEDSEEFLVIKAARREDVAGGRHHAAMRAAQQSIERELELERLWSATNEGDIPSTDELLRIIIERGYNG